VISVDFNLFEDLSAVSTFDIPLLTFNFLGENPTFGAWGEIPSRSRYGLEALSVGVAFEDALGGLQVPEKSIFSTWAFQV